MPHPKTFIRIITQLSVAQAAGIFDKNMTADSPGAGQPATIYSRPSQTPFDSVDEDPPVLSVSAEVPTSARSRSLFHFYAWEHGGERQIEVVSFGGFMPIGPQAGFLLQTLVSELRAADPDLIVEWGV